MPLGEEIKEDKDEINKRRKMMDGSQQIVQYQLDQLDQTMIY